MAKKNLRFAKIFNVMMIIFALMLANIQPILAAESKPKQMKVKGELLVKFKENVSKEKQDKALKDHGAKELDEIKAIKVKRISVPESAQEKVLASLSKKEEVEFVEYNYLAEIMAIPNDPGYANQWHHNRLSTPAAWDISTGTPDFIIAVLDTGVDPAHPDLAGKLVPGYNFYNNNTDSRDVQGHGTKVAGSAAAISNNGIGVTGVSWNSKIMPLRISDPAGYGSYYDMARATVYAVDNGARVVNLSFGGDSYASSYQSAADYAFNKNALVFASAGNSNNNVPHYPAANNHVIAVAATDSSDNKASFSSYGTFVDISAPGASIYTTANGGGYAYVSGTSFSSPISAGVAALVIAANPGLTNVQIESIMKETANDLGAVGYDQYFGYGRVNAQKAVEMAMVTTPEPINVDLTAPNVSITNPTNGSTIGGYITVRVSATDNIGVTKVELYKDGVLYSSSANAPYSLSFNTYNDANGTHTLEAKAYDANNNIGRSAVVTVNVYNAPDTQAPNVTINLPTAGTLVSGKNITISYTSSDNREVVQVNAYVDGKLVNISATAGTVQFRYNTNKIFSGTHQLLIEAYDAAGNRGVATSTFITK